MAQRSILPENGRAKHVAHQGRAGFVGGGQAEGALFALDHRVHRPAGKELVRPDEALNILAQHLCNSGVPGVGGVDIQHDPPANC